MRPEGFPPGKLAVLNAYQGELLQASMRPEGFPPGKAAGRVLTAAVGEAASMRPEGFPPGKVRRAGADAEGGLASMRPEGFPPGKLSRLTLTLQRLMRCFNEAGRFPSRKTVSEREYWKKLVELQ